VLGETVSVKRGDITEANEVVAVCYRGHVRQAIPILARPLPTPPPAGWEWIEATVALRADDRRLPEN
jgi:hypothetical protein